MYYYQGPQTRKCRVIEHDDSMYQTLLIYDVDNKQYLMVTVFPNWQGEIPQKGDTGYMEFEFVKGGIDTYYDKETKQNVVYSNTYLFFRKFITDKYESSGSHEISL